MFPMKETESNSQYNDDILELKNKDTERLGGRKIEKKCQRQEEIERTLERGKKEIV